ncbi:MAG TPA: Maf family nucleotide pyrophosphatase [Casimicrobiaceae bacterium]|nr:Maf family nucleotide pyrophosphatase [Casimicrobiaceae bacterium]
MEKAPQLVLASTSIYREALLARLGITFTTAAPGVDETPLPGEAPARTACRLAEAKARAVAARMPGALVLGSDQIADVDGMAVGKPGNHETAVRQLVALSGRSVVFHTAVALANAATGRCEVRLVDVTTKFRSLTRAAIDAYLLRDAPYDCAASIKAETLGIAIVESIRSDDPTALIGLPLITVVDLLRAEGVDVIASAAP